MITSVSWAVGKVRGAQEGSRGAPIQRPRQQEPTRMPETVAIAGPPDAKPRDRGKPCGVRAVCPAMAYFRVIVMDAPVTSLPLEWIVTDWWSPRVCTVNSAENDPPLAATWI